MVVFNALLSLIYGFIIGLRALWISIDRLREVSAVLEGWERRYRDRPSLVWIYNVVVAVAVVTFFIASAW